MKVFYVMVLVLVAGAVPSHGRTESEGTVFNKTQFHGSMSNVTVSSSKLVTYGFLYLVMQWPRSFCNREIILNRQCNQPVPSRFTVHGLWPQYDPMHGVDCRHIRPRYTPFDFQRLSQTLLPGLNYHWPDLKSIVDNNRHFWSSQYNKHGSCTFNDQDVYFGLTLTLAESLEGRLSRAFGIGLGRLIIPGNYYSPTVIKDAVRRVTSKWPRLKCIMVENIIQLLEIRFCASRNGNRLSLIDCSDSNNDCWNQQWVYFPPA